MKVLALKQLKGMVPPVPPLSAHAVTPAPATQVQGGLAELLIAEMPEERFTDSAHSFCKSGALFISLF